MTVDPDHMYARVDAARVHEILSTHLGDLRAFAGAVARLVDPLDPFQG